ncbi:MAG: hypothetical protein NC489_08190 [Ruminococcus flavefaciens]|nr:hypothetical protein [Ruminococcus flavefaciens]
MAIVKRRLNYNNAGTEQTLHFETSSDLVLRNDGTNAEDSLKTAEAAIVTLNNAIAQANAALEVLRGTGDGSMAKAIADGIASVVANAPEDLNDLMEISTWIHDHEDDASGMNAKIQANATAISNLQASGAKVKEITFTAANFASNVYTIPAATHGMASGAFVYQLYRLDGSAYKNDSTWTLTEAQVAYNADKSISITATGGFAGKIVLIG